jgi:hypothetical protein
VKTHPWASRKPVYEAPSALGPARLCRQSGGCLCTVVSALAQRIVGCVLFTHNHLRSVSSKRRTSGLSSRSRLVRVQPQELLRRRGRAAAVKGKRRKGQDEEEQSPGRQHAVPLQERRDLRRIASYDAEKKNIEKEASKTNTKVDV